VPLNAVQIPIVETPIALGDIDWRDTTFRITYGRPLEPLRTAIQAIGMQQVPVLQQVRGDRLRIVSGRRRLRVWQQLHRTECPARLIFNDPPEKDLFLFNFYEHLGLREPNVIEQALSLEKLLRYFPEEQVLSKFMVLLGLPPNKTMLRRSVVIAGAGPGLWPAIQEGKIFPEILEWIARDFPSLRDLLTALLVHLHWGYQKQKEFLAGLNELAFREQVDPETLLTSVPLTDWLMRWDLTPPQKGEAIRKIFHQRLFPVSTATEKEFQGKRTRMGLDSRTRLTPPPFFEGGTYRLEVRFNEEKELRESLDRLAVALETGCFKDLP
jgi:hypothetical protein